MRIVVHGQGTFGKAVLERLLECGENVVAVCSAPTKEGRTDDPLVMLAKESALSVHQPASWKTPEALELMQSFDADVCMMAYVVLFIPEGVLNAPRFGTFQYHPSLCPHHRGPSSINWPIAMGEAQTGLTIFWPNDGLDEGPILMQKTCKIGTDETLGDIYFNKLFPMGVDAMIESLDLVRSGVILKHDQRLEDGSYESWFSKDQAEINWADPVEQSYNKIRAANPAPGAWTTYNGLEIQIYDVRRADGDGMPGEIVMVSDDDITVQCNGGRILIKRLRPQGGKKQSAGEWAHAAKLTHGAKFE